MVYLDQQFPPPNVGVWIIVTATGMVRMAGCCLWPCFSCARTLEGHKRLQHCRRQGACAGGGMTEASSCHFHPVSDIAELTVVLVSGRDEAGLLTGALLLLSEILFFLDTSGKEAACLTGNMP